MPIFLEAVGSPVLHSPPQGQLTLSPHCHSPRTKFRSSPVVQATREALLQESARLFELAGLLTVGQESLVRLSRGGQGEHHVYRMRCVPHGRQDPGEGCTYLFGDAPEVAAGDVKEWERPAGRMFPRLHEPAVECTVRRIRRQKGPVCPLKNRKAVL